MEVYRIAKWEETFETADSRRHRILTWVSMPVGFTSHGFQSMIDEFGEDSPAIYGAWCALVALAATMPERGVLCSSKGIPLTVPTIARLTFFPESVFNRLFDWAKRPEIAWILCSTSHQPVIDQSSTSRQPVIDQSPTSRQPVVNQSPTGLPNQTKPVVSMLVTVVDFNFEELDETAKKFKKLSGCPLKPDLLGLTAGIVLATGDTGQQFLSDISQTMRSKGISRPAAYITGALRKFCQANGLDYGEISNKVKQRIAEVCPRVEKD